jgi:hypothetical protein
MNLYFLLEGKRTEPKIYPNWLTYLLPSYTQIKNQFDVKSNNYFLISGKGYPSLLHNHLKNSIVEINEIELFDYLVIVLDSEEETIEYRIKEVNNFIRNNKLNLNCELKIIVQHRCIETWLLGNKKVFTRNPSDYKLKEFIKFYNVSLNDPEGLPKLDGYNSIAGFHLDYLKYLLKEHNIHYTKNHPRDVIENYYLNELITRTNDGHLASFKDLIDFCNYLEINNYS